MDNEIKMDQYKLPTSVAKCSVRDLAECIVTLYKNHEISKTIFNEGEWRNDHDIMKVRSYKIMIDNIIPQMGDLNNILTKILSFAKRKNNKNNKSISNDKVNIELNKKIDELSEKLKQIGITKEDALKIRKEIKIKKILLEKINNESEEGDISIKMGKIVQVCMKVHKIMTSKTPRAKGLFDELCIFSRPELETTDDYVIKNAIERKFKPTEWRKEEKISVNPFTNQCTDNNGSKYDKYNPNVVPDPENIYKKPPGKITNESENMWNDERKDKMMEKNVDSNGKYIPPTRGFYKDEETKEVKETKEKKGNIYIPPHLMNKFDKFNDERNNDQIDKHGNGHRNDYINYHGNDRNDKRNNNGNDKYRNHGGEDNGREGYGRGGYGRGENRRGRGRGRGRREYSETSSDEGKGERYNDIKNYMDDFIPIDKILPKVNFNSIEEFPLLPKKKEDNEQTVVDEVNKLKVIDDDDDEQCIWDW
jgi:hypothetical protein